MIRTGNVQVNNSVVKAGYRIRDKDEIILRFPRPEATDLVAQPIDFDILFEVISAVGTVGLSLGLTAKFGVYGKTILIICMFLGRVGPATLAMITLRKQREIKIKYPEDRVVLG